MKYSDFNLRLLITSIISLMLCFDSAAYPLIRNYSKKIYGGGTQNWEICQDSFGRMLFANNSGLIIYDSQKWTLDYIGNYTTVRCVFFDEGSGRIYVGGSEDFGYFDNSSSLSKDLRYTSLIETIPQHDRHFNEIWEIHKYGNYLWFQSDFCVFRYDGKRTMAIPYKYKITASELINGNLYIASKEGGVCVFNGKKFVPVSGNELLVGKRVCAILPYMKSDMLFVTEMSGIYRYDGNGIKPLITDIDDFLKENQVFCAATNGRELVFGTVNNGIVIKDIATNANTYANTKTGMQNNTVLSIYFDKSDNIWLGLDNGIDYILYNSPISTLFGTNEYGAGYASLLHGNTLYLGTNQGVYSTQYPIKPSPDPLPLTRLMKSQTWCLDTIGSDIFIGNDLGLFCHKGNATRQIAGVPGTWYVIPLKKHPQYALASTYEGFYLLKHTGNQWTMENKLEGYNEAGGKMIEDTDGYIWISHWIKGVFRLHISGDMRRFDDVKLYNSKKGFPTDHNNTLYLVNGQLSFSTEGGFYNYDKRNDRMVFDKRMNELFGVRTSIRLYQSPKNDIWGVSAKYICKASFNATDSYDIDTTTYKPMLNRLIIGFEDFNFLSQKELLVSNEDGFFEIDTDKRNSTGWHGKLFMNSIYATGLSKDSLIYAPGDKNFKELKLPYRLNSLKFEFISPEYREQGVVEYSYYLENYDSEWSAYTPINSKEYTKLHEGTYTLHIRSYNKYDDSRSELAFRFTIAPPWFRSVWAIIIYLSAMLVSAYYAFRLIRAKSRKAAIIVAKQKEEELAEYKRETEKETLLKENEINRLKSEQLEHDIRHKSQELSNATMNVIRKNEILIDIQHMVGKIQQSDDKTAFSTGVNRQLNKIQQLIKENISHDDDWQKFAHNFDVVYENYLKRLTGKHPNLSIGDQRLCAYLKMGLSSKEIAPLLNMSYRSVEMSRYRLRKKMELSRETNLVEYLQHL